MRPTLAWVEKICDDDDNDNGYYFEVYSILRKCEFLELTYLSNLESLATQIQIQMLITGL